MQWIDYEPLPKACFDPDGMLQTLEVLEWGDYFHAVSGDELKQLASFGKLRMLKIQISEPTAEDLANLCEVMPASLKVLYFNWDASRPLSLVEWSVFGVLQGLVELCICTDSSCDFAEGVGPATITSHLAQLLPKTTILVREDWFNEIGGPLHITDREFLPRRVPDWHRLPGAYQPPVGS